MNTLLESAIEHLKTNDFIYCVSPDQRWIWLSMSGEKVSSITRITTSDEGNVLTAASILPMKIPECRRTECALLVTLYNTDRRLGAFHLNLLSGELLFCIS